MNNKIEKYIKRTSVRNFTGKKMNQDDIKKIVGVINNSPTSFNHQQFSAILIQNEKTLNWISERNWHQEHIKKSALFIVFVADRYRVQKVNEINGIEHNPKIAKYEVVKSMIDATIACTYAMNAAMDMGYGTTMIGGIQSFGSKLNAKLKLPKNAYSIVALSIGEIGKKNVVKPKFNKTFIEEYDSKKSFNDFIEYDKQTYEEFSSRKNGGIIDDINAWNDPKKHSSENDGLVLTNRYISNIFDKMK